MNPPAPRTGCALDNENSSGFTFYSLLIGLCIVALLVQVGTLIRWRNGERFAPAAWRCLQCYDEVDLHDELGPGQFLDPTVVRVGGSSGKKDLYTSFIPAKSAIFVR